MNRCIRVQHELSALSILKIAGLALAALILVRGWPAVLLILVALMSASALQPLHTRLAMRVGRRKALLILIAGLLIPLVLVAVLIVPALLRQIGSLVGRIPETVDLLYRWGRDLGLPLGRAEIPPQWVEKIPEYVPHIVAAIANVLGGMVGAVTAVALAIYLLADGPEFGAAAIRLLPRRHRLPARQMLSRIAADVGNYVRGQLVLSALAGLSSFALLTVVGVPDPLALAFLMAITDAIPIAGAFIGSVPAVLIASHNGALPAVAVAAGYIIYQQIENHILLPRILGRAMNLPSSIILIAVMVGITLMGPVGGLLALPVAAALPAIIRFIGEAWDRETETRAAAAGPSP
jgi:predicted PurR-regulated permease PerM